MDDGETDSADSTDNGVGSSASDPGSSVDDRSIETVLDAAMDGSKAVADYEFVSGARPEEGFRLASILVAIGDGPHDGAAIDFARHLATTGDAWIDLFHVVPSSPSADETTGPDRSTTGQRDRSKKRLDVDGGGDDDDGEGSTGSVVTGRSISNGPDASNTSDVIAGRVDSADGSTPSVTDRLLDAAEARLGDFDRSDRWVLRAEDTADAIVEQGEYYDVVVVGSSSTGTVRRLVLGSIVDTVVRESTVPVIVVEGEGSTALRAD